MSMDGRPQARANLALSLVIPAYNEEAVIRQAIDEADRSLADWCHDYEILVVDDGSSDGTADAVMDAARNRTRVRLLRHGQNLGYGAALGTGFKAARFDRVAFTDADRQFDLGDLATLTPLTDQYSLAVGYRLQRQDNWQRRLYSRGYNLLARSLLGTRVRDCDCALKVFRKDALANLLPQTQGFFVNTEMLTRARQLGYGVVEVGVRHRPRLHGTSKVSLADIPRTLATLLPFWWSRILFPGDQSARQLDRQGKDQSLRALVAVVFVAALLFFSRLRSPLLEPDEARYAEIPRQMLTHGQFLIPTLHGEPYMHKPPLLYWLTMGAYSLFGIHDWVARLIPCSAAFLTVVVAYLWAGRTVGTRAALVGALMLCLSARFVYMGRMLTMDSLLCLWVVLAWAAAHVAFRGTVLAWKWWLVSALACGLGLLTKGPVALVLVGVPVIAYQLLDSRLARARWLAWLTYLAIALSVAAPWYIASSILTPSLVGDFFWTHNFLRFLQPLDHEGPVWYYLPSLLLGMLPWTLLLPGLLRFLGRKAAVPTARRPAGMGFFLLAFLWCLVFYTLAGCKRPGYILPAMPPLALALGCYLDSALPRKLFRRAARAVPVCFQQRLAHASTLLVLGVAFATASLGMSEGLLQPAAGFLFGTAAIGTAGYFLYRGPERNRETSWLLCGCITLVILTVSLHQVLPGYERKFSLRHHVRPRKEMMLEPQGPVACYPHRWESVSFYLQRDDVRVYPHDSRQQFIADLRKQSSTLVFVKSDDTHGQPLRELLQELPASMEFVPQGPQGIVTAGFIRRRMEVPPTLLAGR
jgi:dolichol-phosphate mannosyltransferase